MAGLVDPLTQCHHQGCKSLSSVCLSCPWGPVHSRSNSFHTDKMAAAVQMSLAAMTISRAQKMEPPSAFQGLLLKTMKTLLRRLPDGPSLTDQNWFISPSLSQSLVGDHWKRRWMWTNSGFSARKIYGICACVCVGRGKEGKVDVLRHLYVSCCDLEIN